MLGFGEAAQRETRAGFGLLEFRKVKVRAVIVGCK